MVHYLYCGQLFFNPKQSQFCSFFNGICCYLFGCWSLDYDRLKLGVCAFEKTQYGWNSNLCKWPMLLRILFEKAIIAVMVIDHIKSFESIPRDKGARHATDEQGNGIAIQYLIDQPFDSWVSLGFLSPLLPTFIPSEYLATATNRMVL